jgi:hypothetical protein
MLNAIKAHPGKFLLLGVGVLIAGAFLERATGLPMNWTPFLGSMSYQLATPKTTTAA